jgi:hypothetical protein
MAAGRQHNAPRLILSLIQQESGAAQLNEILITAVLGPEAVGAWSELS